MNEAPRSLLRGYLAKFSDPSAKAFGRRAEATTLLRQGYGGFPFTSIPVAAYSVEVATSATKAGSYGVFGEGE